MASRLIARAESSKVQGWLERRMYIREAELLQSFQFKKPVSGNLNMSPRRVLYFGHLEFW